MALNQQRAKISDRAMFSSIQRKNTVYVISVLVLFLALLLCLNYFFLKNYSLENAQRSADIILDSADSQLDIMFDDIEAVVSSLTTLRTVREVDTDELQELFISNVFVRNDIVRAIYLGTNDGRMFEWGIGEGFIHNKPEFPPDYDPRVRPWYKLAAETGGYCLTPPYLYASVEAMGITAAKPVVNNGEFVGVLGLDLILYGLENLVNSLEIPLEGKVILTNREGIVLVNQFAPAAQRVIEVQRFPHQKHLDEIDGFMMDFVFGDRYMISNRENDSTGWRMMLFIPYSEVMQFSNRIMTLIILIDIVLVLLMGFLITTLTRSLITNPLEIIMSALRRYQEGDNTVRIPAIKTKEFNLMARMFNRLIDIGEQSSQKLEEKVENRTKAIIKLQKENVRLRIIEEKEQIYEDLHDSLGASLTSINISNHVARTAMEQGDMELLGETFDRIEKNTMAGILGLKEILKTGKKNARPPWELRDYIKNNIAERLELKEIELIHELPEREEAALLDQELIYNLKKIIQELVSNTMKHSGASVVTIKLKIEGQVLHFRYEDDGKGFSLKEAVKNGFGIQGLYNRSERMNGVLKINSKEGHGSQFSFKFRMPQP